MEHEYDPTDEAERKAETQEPEDKNIFVWHCDICNIDVVGIECHICGNLIF